LPHLRGAEREGLSQAARGATGEALAFYLFSDDRLRSRGADARAAQFAHLHGVGVGAHAAGGFDLHLRRAMLAHQPHVVLGGPAVVVVAAGLLDEAVAGRSFDELGAGPLANLTEADFLLVAGEKVVLEDHLGDRPVPMGGIYDGPDVGLDVGPIAGE